MKNSLLKEIDAVARKYQETKEKRYKDEWYKLIKKFSDENEDKFFQDLDRTKCFKNAIRKKAFTAKEVKDNTNYIMYMCSNSQYDWFKAKRTKKSYKVERI